MSNKNTVFSVRYSYENIWRKFKILPQVKSNQSKRFCEKNETTQQRVSEWECDKIEPSLYNIIRILNIFEITFEELTDGIEEN